ncbi:hypothetical protein Dimus_012421 [Dionaea muscipula]
MAVELEPASVSLARSWRTAFLTLRDETLSCAGGVPSTDLLRDVVLTHTRSLINAAPYLPCDEVTSDLMYLLNLASMISLGVSEDGLHSLTVVCHLIHAVALRVPLELNLSTWVKLLDSFGELVEVLIRNADKRTVSSGNDMVIKAVTNCLDTVKHLVTTDHRRCSLPENVQLVKFLLHLIDYPQTESGMNCSPDQRGSFDLALMRIPRHSSLWKVHTTAFSMIGDAFSRVGSCFPLDIWQSTTEVLRKVMDALASKTLLVEDSVVSKLYASLLNCLHQVLVNRRGSIANHVPSFVTTLRLFLNYGVSNASSVSCDSKIRDQNSSSPRPSLRESSRESGPYRPPHLRRKNGSLKPSGVQASKMSPGHDSSAADFSTSSDSDFSDTDGTLRELDVLCGCKARVAAITCIQDLCEADPKSFTAQWMMLLPTVDVLHVRKNDPTLATCLLFDPYMKVRLASASAIAAMLDGPSAVALQVAEYRESSKCGSYMAFSSSLGQILVQLHTAILYLIQRETHTGLLTSLFKVLLLLISSTPYSRMPTELLPMVLSSLRERINGEFPFKSDQSGLQAFAISCITTALSVSPSSLHINQMLQDEVSSGLIVGQGGPGVLNSLFQLAEPVMKSTTSFEALQALRAACHNYPNIMVSCWRQVSSMVSSVLGSGSIDIPSCMGSTGHGIRSPGEKVIAAAVKVLDECLRALSGFRGTEDAFGDSFVETPFTSDCIRDKKISSAPAYTLENFMLARENSKNCPAGSLEWHEALEKHIALTIRHTSVMVRSASFTCFAGITSPVFFSLGKENQEFILSACIIAAVRDEAPSVRSAACRAIGVIACLPSVFTSTENLHKFINAVDICTHHHLISVRVPASWAMANICDSLRHMNFESYFDVLISLSMRALQLTKDGDKIKSNAVRALGNLSRVIPFHSKCSPDDFRMLSSKHDMEGHPNTQYTSNGSPSTSLGNDQLLDSIVQAFLSCIATGNVKVQWNVCHALSNLFLNESIRIEQMGWAPSVYSILLILLRDSPNYKIRIQAAEALAVPSTVLAYGSSLSDVVQGVEHILENLGSEQNLLSSNFKYKIALEKQLTSTMLHLLGLCANSGNEPLEEFLLRKVSFFEEWFKRLCISLEETSIHDGDGLASNKGQKMGLISTAIRSLVQVYEGRNQPTCARRLDKVLYCLL